MNSASFWVAAPGPDRIRPPDRSLACGRRRGRTTTREHKKFNGEIVGRACPEGEPQILLKKRFRPRGNRAGTARLRRINATLLAGNLAFPTAPCLRAARYTRVTPAGGCGGRAYTKVATGLAFDRAKARGSLRRQPNHVPVALPPRPPGIPHAVPACFALSAADSAADRLQRVHDARLVRAPALQGGAARRRHRGELGIAFVEYCMAVPANRWGSAVYTTAQLKTMQEVITLLVFAGFSILYLKEPIDLELRGRLCADRGRRVFRFPRPVVIVFAATVVHLSFSNSQPCVDNARLS